MEFSAKVQKKREKEVIKNKNTKQEAKQKFSLFLSKALGQKPSIPKQNLKTTPKKDQGKEKGRIKEEERRKKEEEGQASNSISNLISKNQVYHVHNAILR